MQRAVLLFLINPREETVWLAPKKRKIGVGKYNGYGGKIEESETDDQALIRETFKESTVKISPWSVLIGRLVCQWSRGPKWQVNIYKSEHWQGQPRETAEMGVPRQFPIYGDFQPGLLMDGDEIWLPQLLRSRRFMHITMNRDSRTEKASNLIIREYKHKQRAR